MDAGDRTSQTPWLVLTAVLAGIGFTLGVTGWALTAPEVGFDGWLIGAVQLFTFESAEGLTPLLRVARMFAFAVWVSAMGNIVVALYRHLRRSRQLARALKASGHVVVVGDGPEVPKLAQRLADQTSETDGAKDVVVIGQLSADDQAELNAMKVPVLTGLDDALRRQVMHGARSIFVAGSDDSESAALLTHVTGALKQQPSSTTTVVALFDSPVLTRQWDRASTDGVFPISRVSKVALATIEACPPYPVEAVAPSPIIVGSGPYATELGRRIVTGWQHEGWQPRIHCITDSPGWTRELKAQYGDSSVLVHDVAMSPSSVVAEIRQLLKDWQPPLTHSNTDGHRIYTLGRASIYVALEQPALTVTLARAALEMKPLHITVADAVETLPAPSVALIVDEKDHWDELLTDYRDRAVIVSQFGLLTHPSSMTSDQPALLDRQLRRTAMSWPREAPQLFSSQIATQEDRAKGAQLRGLDLLTREDAKGAKRVLGAGAMTVLPGLDSSPVPVLNPQQLLAMEQALIEELRGEVPTITVPEARLWRLRLAAGLPEMMQRSGWIVTSTVDPVMTYDDVATLAPRIHRRYQKIEGALRHSGSKIADIEWDALPGFVQASNRAVALDYPVKLAFVGLDWRRSDNPRPAPSLSPEQTLELAKQEHHRFVHYQIRNGRKDHPWSLDWEKLGDVQGLDFDIINTMSDMLASVSIEIFNPTGAETPPG